MTPRHRSCPRWFAVARRVSAVLAAAMFAGELPADPPAIQSGPMVGHVDLASANIWVQTTAPAAAAVRWWPATDRAAATVSAEVRTAAETGHVAKFHLPGLSAGTTYHYEILLDGAPQAITDRAGRPVQPRFATPPKWRFVTSGRRDGHSYFDFRFAAGSCFYINDRPGDNPTDRAGTPYGGGYEIVEQIPKQNPDFMIWLGDNIYLRENDWTSWSGLLHRYTHTRSIPHLQPLLATLPHYAIWDDHDFGPNNSDRSFWNKGQATEAFNLFWANPSAGLPEASGIFTFFNWGDVNFYLLDNRTHRDPNELDPGPWGRRPDFLGRAQLEWLIGALKHAQDQSSGGGNPSYPVSFHVICVGSQALDTGGNPDAWPAYREEWQEFIDRVVHEGIEGVVFLTGDIHRSEMGKMQVIGGGQPGVPGKAGIPGATYTFYEVTVSPLAAGPSNWKSSNPHALPLPEVPEVNTFRTRNFVTFDVKGPREDRRMEVRFFDTEGRQLNQLPDRPAGEVDPVYVIRANDLKIRRPDGGGN